VNVLERPEGLVAPSINLFLFRFSPAAVLFSRFSMTLLAVLIFVAANAGRALGVEGYLTSHTDWRSTMSQTVIRSKVAGNQTMILDP
jgi:hypothetical protein